MRVEETPDQGGVDFRAQKDNVEFVIEVKSIRRETFAEHSGVPDNWVPGRTGSVRIDNIAHRIRSEVSGATEQMSGYDCPRILAIACEHHEFSTYLKKSEEVGDGAEMFLTSPLALGLPNLNHVTSLDDSLFFRFQDDRIVFCRESISAVLLFYISKYHAKATGLLHPAPVYNFSVDFLPSVPFVEVLISGTEDKTKTRWIPDNLPEGLFIYNQWR